MAFQELKRACENDGQSLFIWTDNDDSRGNDFKPKEGRLIMDIGEEIVPCEVDKALAQIKALPRGAVTPPSLNVFKARLDRACSSLG